MYSRNQLNKAGNKLITSKSEIEIENALDMINRWRANHLHPLRVLKNNALKLLELNSIIPVLVSQRLKRLQSITYKLDLYESMGLGGMQDIGGYRIVVKDVKDLKRLKNLLEANLSKHRMERTVNYVVNPKESGYRSIHFVYKYYSSSEKYSGLKLELQIRTKLQHNWATAVETAGLLTNTSLKSSQGSDEWLEFFKIVSSLFAIKESLPKLIEHQEIETKDLMIKYFQICKRLNVIENLRALRVSTKHIESGQLNGDYYILRINVKNKNVRIGAYNKNQFEKAAKDYAEFEKESVEGENAVVLVSATSIKALKKAYPSYFLDTSEFIQTLDKMNSNCIERGFVKS